VTDTSAIDEQSEHELLRRYWYAASYASALDSGAEDGGLVSVTILDEDIVIARLDGELVASLDQCPHRGAPLSGGIVVDHKGSACLQCPYHALHFDAAGTAVHLPAAPGDRLPSRLNLRLLPCEEHHGIVWVCLDPEPLGHIPPWETFDQPGVGRYQNDAEIWHAMPSRVSENFNDLAHLSFIHAQTFGDPANTEVPPEALTVSDDGHTITHMVTMAQLDRVTHDGPLVPVQVGYTYIHTMAFSTELCVQYDEDRAEWIQMTATPVSPTSALVFQQSVRNFEIDGDLAGWQEFQKTVNGEDRDLLEVLKPERIGLDGAQSGEVALSVDAFTIAYRRLWRALLG
jgi:phenylpropionate dioxygenase-like ring-hydroxylating dioxygenase large terminal subunit